MAINIQGTSPIHNARTELQMILSNFGPEILEQIVIEMGLSKVETTDGKKQNATFDEASEFYLSSSDFLKLSKSSKKTYKSELNQYKSFVSKELKDDITLKNSTKPIIIVKYLNRCKSSNTKAKKSAFLRSFLKCVFKQFLNEDITDIKDVLKLKRTNDTLPRALTKIQLAEIISLSQMYSNELRNYTILWTFLGSGIRLSELVNLQIKDINTETQTIKVIPKGNEETKKERKISRLALLILQDFLKFKYDYLKNNLTENEYNDLYIFSTNNGRTHINIRTIQQMIKKLINNAKTIPQNEKKRYSTHTFRHCFAIYGLESGIDIYTLSKLLGHDSINSTTIYLKLFDNQLQAAIEKHPFAKEEKIKILKRIGEEI